MQLSEKSRQVPGLDQEPPNQKDNIVYNEIKKKRGCERRQPGARLFVQKLKRQIAAFTIAKGWFFLQPASLFSVAIF